MILWVKSVPQHHLSLYTGHHKRTEVARSWGEVSLLLFAEGWIAVPSTEIQLSITLSSASAKWWHCRQSEHHLSPLHVLSMWCLAVGREGGPCRSLLPLLLPLLLLRWPGAASGSQEGLHVPSRDHCRGGPVPGEGRATPAPQLSVESWTECCIITHPCIQPAASWGWQLMHKLSPDFGGNHLGLFHNSEFSK